MPLKFVEKLFFNRSLISGLILLRKAWALNLSCAFVICVSMCFLLLLAPGSALEKFAAIVNPENKPTKVPVPWKFVEKTFL